MGHASSYSSVQIAKIYLPMSLTSGHRMSSAKSAESRGPSWPWNQANETALHPQHRSTLWALTESQTRSMSGCRLSNAFNSKSRWTSYLAFLFPVHRLLEVRTAPILCGFHEAQSFGMISTSSTQVPRGFVANLRASNGQTSCREGHFNFGCGLHRWTLTRNCMQCRHCLPSSFFTLMFSLSNALLCWGWCWNVCHCGEPLKKNPRLQV